jgi:hypothetical protein
VRPPARHRPDRAPDEARAHRDPAGIVFGVIAIGALLAAESGSHETYLETIASALVAAGLYWLAHAYTGALGRRLHGGARLTAATLLRALSQELGIVGGAAIPLVALLVAWATGAAQETAVTAAFWTAIAAVIAFEALAAIRSSASMRELVTELVVGVALGAGVLALRIILH